MASTVFLDVSRPKCVWVSGPLWSINVTAQTDIFAKGPKLEPQNATTTPTKNMWKLAL